MAPDESADRDSGSKRIDTTFQDPGVAFELQPRPVTAWIRALRDWTNVTLDITESRARGEISPYVILPRAERDLTLLVQASVQQQLTEATVRGEEVVAIRFECDRADAARVLLGLRVFSEFAVELAEEGRLQTAPGRDTLMLLADVAAELSAETPSRETMFSPTAQARPQPPAPR